MTRQREIQIVQHPKRAHNNAGFTLLETLVALAILAIALAAVLRATGAATNHAGDMRIRLLADWVAQNRLALHAARGDWIQVGIANGEETQAGVRLLWKEEIINTPNPAFRRIEITVSDPTEIGDHVLRKLSGYLVQVSRK
jgi:general secretion pathway protein I